MEIIITGVFLFLLALLFAFLEIEIEGKNGWAKKLPTWYQKSGSPRIFYKSFSKPLTGYHFIGLLFMILFFHSAFFFGLPWTLANEVKILVSFFIVILSEDFLWFVFNPYFGLKKFKKNKVWWHEKQRWFFKRIPSTYVSGFLEISIFAFIFSIILNQKEIMINYIISILTVFVLTVISTPFVPMYRQWYMKMRENDESKLFNRRIKFEKF